MKFIPRPYQQYAIDKILQQPAVGLFLDMGLGKTAISLTAAADLLHDSFEVRKVLVIAPKRVAETVWTDEAQKWDHLKYLKIAKVLGSEKKRLAALAEKADIWVINRENVVWLVNHYGAKWPFDMVIIDELSSFKSTKAERFRALRRVRPYIKRIVGLTGTPAPNSLIDLWPQIYLLDQGQRLGKTVGGYRERYFYPDKMKDHIVYKWRLKPGAEAAIHEAISDLCISMESTLGQPLPEVNYISVKMSEKEMKLYRELERERVLEIAGSDDLVVAAQAAVLSNKLLQMANGAVYDESGGVQPIHEAKLEALADLIEAANGQPVLVFYTYKHDLARITKYLWGHGHKVRQLKSAQDITDWNTGSVPIMLAHPMSAGHGLNLQDGGHIVVWFGLTWSLELYQQGNKRLDRPGQLNRVVIHHLIAEGTIDEDVIRALKKKDVGQAALIEALQVRIEGVI